MGKQIAASLKKKKVYLHANISCITWLQGKKRQYLCICQTFFMYIYLHVIAIVCFIDVAIESWALNCGLCQKLNIQPLVLKL